MPRPTEAQKEAGNYAKHRIYLHGLPISIENRKGTIRSGSDSAGRPWSVVMPYDYGYIRRTVGADGDQVDVFLGPNRTSQFVVVVNQHEKQTGRFEEIKVGLGYLTLEQAKAAYHQGYRGRHVPRATFKTTTVQRLKEWLRLRQTWTQFDLSAAARLTNFGAGMKKPAKQEDKPSTVRKVAATLGAGAALAGFYRYTATRPDVLKRNYQLKRAQVAADPARKARLGNTSYAQSLRHQPAPTKTPPYSGGDKFNYGVTEAPSPAPQEVRVKARGHVLEPKVLGKKPKLKTQIKVSTKFSARLALIQFQERNRDGTMGVSTSPLTAYRKASRVVPWVGRAGQAAGDIGDIASGKEVKDPFYKKAWFKRAATTAAIGVPLLAANLAHSGARKNAEGVPVRTDKTFGGSVDRISRKAASAKARIDRKLGFSSKLKPILLQAVVRHLENFDYTADQRGWDLRDARGKSARVFAPGSKRRDRREKTWSEKTENIRLVRNVAIAGTLAAGGAALHYRNKANRLAPKAAPNLAPVVPGDFRKVKQASAVVGTVDLSRKDAPVGIHGLIDATKANLPDRPELPGEGAVKFVYGLPPKKRAGVLRVLGAGALAGGGLVGGTIAKRPRTGAALGGLGAGLLLG